MLVEKEEIRWQIDVPIFTNKTLLKQLALGIGLPFGLLILFIVATARGSGDMTYASYAVGLIVAVLALTWLFVMVVYRGCYSAEFRLNQKHASCRYQAGQARKNELVNKAAFVLGMLTGKLTVAGAGALAQSRQSQVVTWKQVTKAHYSEKDRTIVLHGGLLERLVIFCSAENYAEVAGFVARRLG